jgi:hypothetical protein
MHRAFFSRKVAPARNPKKPRKDLGGKKAAAQVTKKAACKTQLQIFLRLNTKATPKGMQFTSQFIKLIMRYPRLTSDMQALMEKAKISGKAFCSYLSIGIFDPKDKSSSHDRLYVANLKGLKFFVKEVRMPVKPQDAITQFSLHENLKEALGHLGRWNATVLTYDFAWRSKERSILAAKWIPGIQLEKWLSNKGNGENNNVFRRFLKIERYLKKKFGARDVTTKNALYNEKTGLITIIDLHPNPLAQ